MESRAWTFAGALQKCGSVDVSFVVDDCGQGPVRKFNGITVYARTNRVRTELSGLVRRIHRARAVSRSSAWPGSIADIFRSRGVSRSVSHARCIAWRDR